MSEELTKPLLELPENIKTQSQKIADLTIETEKLRISTETSRMQALEIVINLKEGDKQKYNNDKARKVAQERLLADDHLYLDNCDALARQEYQLKTEQI